MRSSDFNLIEKPPEGTKYGRDVMIYVSYKALSGCGEEISWSRKGVDTSLRQKARQHKFVPIWHLWVCCEILGFKIDL